MSTINKAAALRRLFPAAKPFVDYEVCEERVYQDESDREGVPHQEIRNWQLSEPIPDDAALALAAAEEEAAMARAAYVGAVKTEAQRRIVALLGYGFSAPVPPWIVKQTNMLASSLEALLPLLSGEQLVPLAPTLAFWGKVKAIRAFSNWLETQPVDTDIAAAEWPE